MLVGYARSSTVEQKAGLIAQHDALSAVGCERTFSEQVSSVGKREQLEAAISFARDGDTFVITRPQGYAFFVQPFDDAEEVLR